MHLLAVVWWLAFWESIAMDQIPTNKVAENRRVVWQMDRNMREFIFESFSFTHLYKQVFHCSRT